MGDKLTEKVGDKLGGQAQEVGHPEALCFSCGVMLFVTLQAGPQKKLILDSGQHIQHTDV